MEYIVNKETAQIEPDAEMSQYILITELSKMSYDDMYELVSELPTKTQGHLYEALRDQMDYEN